MRLIAFLYAKKRLYTLVVAIIAVADTESLRAAEIKGKVARVDGEFVRIVSDSDLLPNVGEKAEIYFQIPGLDDAAHVALLTVTEANGQFIVAKIDKASGKIVQDQLARITSEKPRKKGTVPTSDSVSKSDSISSRRRIGEAGPVLSDEYRGSSHTQLQHLGVALHTYVQDNGHFPSDVTKNGRAMLSWRVELLPYVMGPDYNGLRERFHRDEPWDSPHNKTLLSEMPAGYALPKPASSAPTVTHFLGISGPGAFFEANRHIEVKDVRDGLSSTLMVVEARTPVPWTKPEDLPYTAGRPLPKLEGVYRDGFHALFADGQVLFLPKGLVDADVRAIITRDGLETRPVSIFQGDGLRSGESTKEPSGESYPPELDSLPRVPGS